MSELDPTPEIGKELPVNYMRWITYSETIDYFIADFHFILRFNYDIKNNIKGVKPDLIKLIQLIRPLVDGCIILIMSNIEFYTIKNIKFDKQGAIEDLDIIYQFDPAKTYPISLYQNIIH